MDLQWVQWAQAPAQATENIKIISLQINGKRQKFETSPEYF